MALNCDKMLLAQGIRLSYLAGVHEMVTDLDSRMMALLANVQQAKNEDSLRFRSGYAIGYIDALADAGKLALGQRNEWTAKVEQLKEHIQENPSGFFEHTSNS